MTKINTTRRVEYIIQIGEPLLDSTVPTFVITKNNIRMTGVPSDISDKTARLLVEALQRALNIMKELQNENTLS